ncbi:MAG: hypothetical protein WAQ27_05185 [Candidatus Microsaccharimonas sp.]
MDITPQDTTIQPISDDQELAKALAGVLPDEPGVAVNGTTPGLQFEETPVPGVTPPAPVAEPVVAPAPVAPEPVVETPVIAEPENNLEGIKKNAIQELRPLIDHVDLPPEEKFDTYLLLIRSTDDATLIEPAHAAAQGITDEKRKAEALLDIIKEIDFLSRKDQPTI